MLKKIFRSYSRKLPSARGQAMVVFALLTPILILFVGVGMDLGWYYLNVSRLQNAADAAALAGAYKLVEQDNFSNYFVKALTSPPEDITKYDKVKLNSETIQVNMTGGEEEAKAYSGKNLGHIVAGESAENSSTAIFDDWNTSADTARHEVKLTSALYAKRADAQWDENGIRYYGVKLKEEVAHLFLRGFDPMDATVVAYVMLRPHDVDLVTVINELENENVIANWEYQNTYKDTSVKWNHYRQTGTNSKGETGKKTISYVAGEYFRTETLNVEIQTGNQQNSGFKSGTSNHSSLFKTPANGSKAYNELEVDSLNIDFNQDISNSISKKSVDWDLGADLPAGINKVTYPSDAMDGWTDKEGDLRIQGLINIRDAWKNRNLMDDDTSNDLTPDPLWVRIESDPWWIGSAAPYVNSDLNSVRQMIISIDKSNTESTAHAFKFKNNRQTFVNNFADGDFNGYEIEGGKAYKYRPFFIFYKGPEVYDEGNTVRQSQPVILNLNADWNGILYAPNSPVVILGNDKKLTGFVVAKEFVQLKTVEDYTGNGYSEFKDKNGKKPMLVKSDEVFTESELNTKYPETDNYEVKKSEDGKTISVYELKKLPKYFIVEAQYVKEMSGYNDNNYVAALKKYREVTDDDIVEIKFPDKDYFGAENNHQIYHVVAADLLDESNLPNGELAKQTDKSKFVQAEYAPVIVVSTNETKYILKKNLPYVRMYIKKNGDNYPYVSVCDLKVAKGLPSNIYSTNGATLADDTNNIYSGQYVTNEYRTRIATTEPNLLVDAVDKNWKVQDLWKVVAFKSDWWNYYDSNASTAKITKTDDNGMKYFISIAEKTEVENYNKNPAVTATYDKIGDDAYFKNGSLYYTYYDYHTNQDGIDVDKGNLKTVIRLVMDNKGNVQTKPLDEGSSELITNDYKFQPDDKGWNKKIKDPETWEKDKDYRIPQYEVLYYKSAFKLSENSCYSYFQIPELHRKNYEYMNVDELNKTSETGGDWNVEDMFFTTRRANWID